MSYRSDYFSNFEPDVKYQTEYELNLLSESEILSLFRNIMNKGVHGLCFSLYEEGQKPGDIITVAQVKRRIEILKPHTKWVRTFSTTEGNELIPEIAKQHGMKTLVGAWLGKDKEKNAEELENLILLCQKGFVDIAAVGNEVLYRNDLSLEELLEQINYIKDRVPGIKVGYVDAYYEFSRHPELVDVSDVVLVNYYPFWEGTNFQNSLDHINNMHQQTKNVAKGKKIIITETGWPSQGENTKDAIPGRMNAIKYFINAQMWSKKEEVDMFYFSSFDESWKVGAEGEVGAYWGLWDKNEKLKFV
jgi:glucan 1,3-beta-glucosidase